MDDDTMDFGPGNQGRQGRPPRWSGRTKRIITGFAAAALLFGTGTAIGIALTGGASASTTSPPVDTATNAPAATPSASASAGTSTTSRCTKLVEQLVLGNNVKLATRLHALCTHPLLRLALVGGEHGTVTFKSKSGPVTAVFERGTVESDTGSVITVTAQDGTTWTWDLASNTVVRQDGKTATVATGDEVFVAGMQASGVNNARLIRIRSTG
jgi:hypothetical protein